MDHNDWSPLSTWKKGSISHLNSWYFLFFFFFLFGSEWAVGRLSCDLPVAGDAYRSTSMLHEAKQKFTSQAKERSKGNKEKKHTTTKRRRRWPPNRSSRPSFESSCTLRTSLHVQNPHLLLLLLNQKKNKEIVRTAMLQGGRRQIKKSQIHESLSADPMDRRGRTTELIEIIEKAPVRFEFWELLTPAAIKFSWEIQLRFK